MMYLTILLLGKTYDFNFLSQSLTIKANIKSMFIANGLRTSNPYNIQNVQC